jgi:predicted ATPase with chaperone activity
MLAKLNTFALVGIDAVSVVAEVDVSAGLPKTVLVGLPEAAVRESVQRIEWAQAVGILSGQLPAEPAAGEVEELFARSSNSDLDFSAVRGQEFTKRTRVVAAGGHNVLMMWTNNPAA